MNKMIIVKADDKLSYEFESANYVNQLENKIGKGIISITDIKEYKRVKDDKDCVYVFLGDYPDITIHQWKYEELSCRIGLNGKNCVLSVFEPYSDDDERSAQCMFLIEEFINNWAEKFIDSYQTSKIPLPKKISNTSMTKPEVVVLVGSGKLSKVEFDRLCVELDKGTYENIGSRVNGKYSPWTVNPVTEMTADTSVGTLLFNYNEVKGKLMIEVSDNFTKENLEILWELAQKKKEAIGWTIAIGAGLTIAAAIGAFLLTRKKDDSECECIETTDDEPIILSDEDDEGIGEGTDFSALNFVT